MNVLIAGSSGLIGEALIDRLRSRGDTVTRLVRPSTRADGVPWEPSAGRISDGALDGMDVVVNLAGRSIGDHRWSTAEKQLLVSSRVDSTRVLAEAIARAGHAPVLINASAVGFYGDRGDEVLTEASPPGIGFFPDLCVAWEAATRPAAEAGSRVVMLRSGIVLSKSGGALARLLAPLGPRWLSPYRWGVAGPVGLRRRWWPWISLEDEVRAILHAIDNPLEGPVNLTAPEPVTHRRFIEALGRALHRPTVVPIPGWVVKLVLGSELARVLVLEGQRVVPGRLEASGFIWDDADIDRAMAAAIDAAD